MKVRKSLGVVVGLVGICFSGCLKCDERTEHPECAEIKEMLERTKVQYEEEFELPQLAPLVDGEPLVEIKTSKGAITIKFLQRVAPRAVENFLNLAKNGYYDDTIFHRVIKGFMIQGGDPTGTGTGGESIWGSPFANEISNNGHHFRGAVSMANSGPRTNGSQFFIVQGRKTDVPPTDDSGVAGVVAESGDPVAREYEKNGGCPWLDGLHTVFGQVVDGMSVVDAIADAATGADDRPEVEIKISHIELKQYDEKEQKEKADPNKQ
jgi:peptidyl-prolyl cis-trans isomerase B (cyclophilin B)